MKTIEIEGPTIVSGLNDSEYRFFKVNYIKTPLVCRSLDEWLFVPIFKEFEYALPLRNFHPKLILDCGGNVGFSAVYFANAYPDAQITVIEPDAANFELLKLNTSHYPNVKCLRAALWDKETHVNLFGDHPAALMTYETDEAEASTVKTTTVSKLLAESQFDEIDILKIDIEGAEKEVFSAEDVQDWLPKVKVLAMELHDRYKIGCSKAVFSAVSKYDFCFHLKGENLFFIREKLMREMYEQYSKPFREFAVRSKPKFNS